MSVGQASECGGPTTYKHGPVTSRLLVSRSDGPTLVQLMVGGGRPDTVQFSSPRVPSSKIRLADLSMFESGRNRGLALAAKERQIDIVTNQQQQDPIS